jgi:hypothetical protein
VMAEKEAHKRRFWVVSPNVRNTERTVPEWSQASRVWKAAFMGYSPSDRTSKRIGYKFAHAVRPNDVLLIARRHRSKPEVVGFGVVRGPFETDLRGFNPTEKFDSLRRLRPFKKLNAAPTRLLKHALAHSMALRKLHPDKNPHHKALCDWLELKLATKGNRNQSDIDDSKTVDARLKKLCHRGEPEFQVRTRSRVAVARKKEEELVRRYHKWLEARDRKLHIAIYHRLRCDAYEERGNLRGNLIEAKASTKRECIRMAVGQLFEYAYLGRKRLGRPNMAILLPEKPEPKTVEWLSELRVSTVWKDKDKFCDNANGLFTSTYGSSRGHQ